MNHQQLGLAAALGDVLADAEVTLQLGGRGLNLLAGGARQRVIYSFSDRLPLGAEALGYRRLPAGLITASTTPPKPPPRYQTAAPLTLG